MFRQPQADPGLDHLRAVFLRPHAAEVRGNLLIDDIRHFRAYRSGQGKSDLIVMRVEYSHFVQKDRPAERYFSFYIVIPKAILSENLNFISCSRNLRL